MTEFTQVTHVELIGPTSVGVQLADDDGAVGLGPIVVSPNDFITDFSTFLTALRAAGAVAPIHTEKLARSWRKRRRELRRELMEGDPWCQRSPAAADLEGRLICEGRPAAAGTPDREYGSGASRGGGGVG